MEDVKITKGEVCKESNRVKCGINYEKRIVIEGPNCFIMKICSWNIRGGVGARKRGLVRSVLRKEKPDIVVLLELKKQVVDNRFVASLWKTRFVDWIVLPAIGSSGGILIMWDPRVVVVSDNLIGEYSVSIEILWKENLKWWFSAIYGPCKPREREMFWDELAGLRSICGDKWCLGGDFNVVRNHGEKMNSLSTTPSMLCFDNLIGDLELIDPPLLNARITWSNFRTTPICCRLDRYLFSQGWLDYFLTFRQTVLPRFTSDHHPVLLDTSKLTWVPSSFRFENAWLSYKSLNSRSRHGGITGFFRGGKVLNSCRG